MNIIIDEYGNIFEEKREGVYIPIKEDEDE